MPSRLVVARPDDIQAYWPLLLPFIEKALTYSGGRTAPDDVLKGLTTLDREGKTRFQLWAVVDERGEIKAIATTEVKVYPHKTACRIDLCSGSARKGWTHHIDGIARWAKSIGCDYLEIIGRPGWKRVFKGKLRHRAELLEMTL